MTELEKALGREKILNGLLETRTYYLDFYEKKCKDLQKELESLKKINKEKENV